MSKNNSPTQSLALVDGCVLLGCSARPRISYPQSSELITPRQSPCGQPGAWKRSQETESDCAGGSAISVFHDLGQVTLLNLKLETVISSVLRSQISYRIQKC